MPFARSSPWLILQAVPARPNGLANSQTLPHPTGAVPRDGRPSGPRVVAWRDGHHDDNSLGGFFSAKRQHSFEAVRDVGCAGIVDAVPDYGFQVVGAGHYHDDFGMDAVQFAVGKSPENV